MDAVNFIKERNRMCTMYTLKRCEGCPANNYGGDGVACIMADKIDAKRLVPIVEKWSAEHPQKTRQDVFLEQYPEARLDGNECVYVCPADVSTAHRDESGGCSMDGILCPDCRREFWSQGVE